MHTERLRMKRLYPYSLIAGLMTLLVACMLAGCYSNNCPMENTVTCNYAFYDAEGTAIAYQDTITVSTLMPGYKTVYTYRKMGTLPITKDEPDPSLVEAGYMETQSQQRNDTILLNKKSNASSIKIPMSYFNAVDTLIFAYRSISSKDTIKIHHSSYPHVELPECGAYRFHHLKSVTATDAAIDHIEISNPNVGYEGATNIKIYFNGVAEAE